MADKRSMKQRMADEYQARKTALPVKFTAGNPETTDINRRWPVEEIHCRLTGTYTVSGSSSTLNSNGFHALNLIRRLNLLLDQKTKIYSVPGFLLQYISDLYTYGLADDGTVKPGTSVGDHDFDIPFVIPINGGPGPASLLDASWRQSLTLEAEWGKVDDIATAGGTHSLSDVELKVDVVQRAGAPAGSFGGVQYGLRPDPTDPEGRTGAGYPVHIIDVRTVNVTAAQNDLEANLVRGHAYQRFAMLTLNDGDPSDAILNRASLKLDQSITQQPYAAAMQADNVARYGWRSRRTGFYVFDIAHQAAPRMPRLPDFMSLRSAATPFELVLDVNNPGGENKIMLALDRYQPPEKMAATA